MKDQLRVSNPPPEPLMIWDGECHFCRHWIERWREITTGEVEYAPCQEIADRFPEIPRELGSLYRLVRSGFRRRGSGLSVTTLPALEKMAVVELPTHSRLRCGF